jgi:dephospho-CoA kinase|tara:strand:- start:63 stop:608 length:546 start_codon:yes stop_codon:yes gene_type:complete
MIIGLTGSIGSGKTAIAKMFSGYKVVDADKIGHGLLNKKEIKSKIIKEFKTINRKKLSLIVFNNKSKLKKLNKIMWPLITREIKSIIKNNKKKNVVIDAAVLIESGWDKLVDKVVVVKVSRKNQIKRLIKSKKYDIKLINKIIKLQLSQEKRLKYADYVIDNNKSLKNIEKQIIKITINTK